MNLASVMRFIEILNNELDKHPAHNIIYHDERNRRKLTNCCFLMGAYMVLTQNLTPPETWDIFNNQFEFESYRDATFSPPDFHLSLLDCWGGLACGKALGWIGATRSDGLYDLEEYMHYDHIANGGFACMCLQSLCAFMYL